VATDRYRLFHQALPLGGTAGDAGEPRAGLLVAEAARRADRWEGTRRVDLVTADGRLHVGGEAVAADGSDDAPETTDRPVDADDALDALPAGRVVPDIGQAHRPVGLWSAGASQRRLVLMPARDGR